MATVLEFHPVSEIFPMMDAAELAALAEDIKQNGQREPIWLYSGKVIDGRNRYEACKLAGVEPLIQKWAGATEHLVAFVLSLNLHRRHLNESQRAMVAAKLATIKSGDHQDEHATQICVAQPQAAAALNVSTRSVQHARKVVSQSAPEVVKAVEQGKVKVSDAAKVADAPKAKQRAALRAVMGGKAPTLAAAADKPAKQQKNGQEAGFNDKANLDLFHKLLRGVDARATHQGGQGAHHEKCIRFLKGFGSAYNVWVGEGAGAK